MPSGPSVTRRPRLLPGALLGAGLVVAAAFTVLAATPGPDRPDLQTCGSGREWVTVRPVVVIASDWKPTTAHADKPTLAGCVDTEQLDPRPEPTDPRG